jgi:hypothetical protein
MFEMARRGNEKIKFSFQGLLAGKVEVKGIL